MDSAPSLGLKCELPLCFLSFRTVPWKVPPPTKWCISWWEPYITVMQVNWQKNLIDKPCLFAYVTYTPTKTLLILSPIFQLLCTFWNKYPSLLLGFSSLFNYSTIHFPLCLLYMTLYFVSLFPVSRIIFINFKCCHFFSYCESDIIWKL